MFGDRLNEETCYHTIKHTELVVAKAQEMGTYYQLGRDEQEDLFFTAWLHDVGYWDGLSAEGHELRGVEMAQTYLKEFGLEEWRINRIKSAILATKIPQQPNGLFESIICDADLYHLGSEKFVEKTLLLKQEKENLGYGDLRLIDWLRNSLAFMLSHTYHTEFAEKHMQPGKEHNIKLLEQKISEELNRIDRNKKEKKKEKDKKKSDRGIETMFRVTSSNHLELSSLADNKANIMISVNSIIISIVVTVLIRKLEEFPNYTIPAILLLTTCLAAMIFAILATRPKVTNGMITKDDIAQKRSNLLYFGNFYQMNVEDYTAGIKEMMEDADFLYSSMARDIFYLGKVLSVKYRLLRKSYNIFMFGFVISVISFLIASLFFEPIQY